MKALLRPALLAATLLTSSAAMADHPFILPSSTIFSDETGMATFDAAGSDHVFFFDHRPIPLASIVVTKPDGSSATPANAAQTRFRSVLDVKLDQSGTWKVASTQEMIGGSLKLDGVERRVGNFGRPGGPGGPGGAQGGGQRGEGAPRGEGGQRPGGTGGPPNGPPRLPPIPFDQIPANATDLHLVESLNRVETFVTVGQPSKTVFKPGQKGIEIDPITHPNEAVAGEAAKFRFLIDGKPASGIKVTVIAGGERYRDDAGAIDLTTGADGTVSFTWPGAGMYWLGAEAEDNHASGPTIEKRRMNYSATFEVMTP